MKGSVIGPWFLQSFDLSTNKIGGNGLGLSHAIKVLRQWDGSLEIETVRNGGTKIKIEIPISA